MNFTPLECKRKAQLMVKLNDHARDRKKDYLHGDQDGNLGSAWI